MAETINNNGPCYNCNKLIEKGKQYYRYVSVGCSLSGVSGKVSNFHKECWERLPIVAGSATPQLLIMGGGGVVENELATSSLCPYFPTSPENPTDECLRCQYLSICFKGRGRR